QNNSSIELIFDPVFLYCVQQTGYNDLSSTDADGDSIVYSFSQILVDSSICPLNSSLAPPISNYHLNSIGTVNPNAIGVNSGLMIINNPTIVQIGTVSVLIKEYRNGVNINQTIFQQIVACIAGCLNSGIDEITNNGIIISPNTVSSI
ncbi:MAG TPA: hypothetical protein PKD91_08680, partial [Bacteroidia bacterium]|nr:hypothetical protein [Bacteroidia bacterium]